MEHSVGVEIGDLDSPGGVDGMEEQVDWQVSGEARRVVQRSREVQGPEEGHTQRMYLVN